MIAHLRGTLIEKQPNFCIIDVQGVGYKVSVPLPVLGDFALGEAVSLYTYHHIREQSMDLYGFEDTEALRFFEMLLSVSGIGPKSALGILNIADPSTLKKAIIAGDTAHLVKVSGIGKKSAEKIALELRDKFEESDTIDGVSMQNDVDTLEALISLGYSQQESREVLKKIPSEIIGTNEKIKEALKLLGTK
tara:strand:+ start:200 stop:772 length:573 start_codon:yes stop_codon:yes gene_type:complete